MLRAFTPAKGQRRYLLVAIDYTKLVEVEAMASTTSKNVSNFVWKSIISRFRLLRSIVTDNGLQVDSREFREFYKEWKISLHFVSVAHLQSNGLAESANKNILDALGKKVGKSKGNWVEELPEILWSYRTTYKTATGKKPFLLAYGTEAVVSSEVRVRSLRIHCFNPSLNEEGLN